MRYSKLMLAVVLGALGSQMAGATPTVEEAAQLGKTLNGFGAIKAGNKEGTIPELTPICTPPAGYKPRNGLAAGGGPYIDPYAADKPLFKITAADVAKYADKLDEGAKELFRLFPQTYYISVYPSHRPACYPAWMYENSIKNVMRPKIVGGDVPSVTGAQAQVPFPIPKTGVEVMWNNILKPFPYRMTIEYVTYFLDSSGRRSMIDETFASTATPYWDNNRTMIPDDQPNKLLVSYALYPPTQVGTMQLRHQFSRMDLKGAPAWSYIPGQRRVRMAPDFSYDGVIPSAGGTMLYDEISGFDGKMDKFDFKLIGRKEIFIPYNNSEAQLGPEEINTPNHIDPAAVRYELHRVWVVEATLKPGERHVQQKKMFYVDEDSWGLALYDGIDHAGKVHHAYIYTVRQEYDKLQLTYASMIGYDFSKRVYVNLKFFGKGAVRDLYGTQIDTTPYRPSMFTPEGMAGSGVR